MTRNNYRFDRAKLIPPKKSLGQNFCRSEKLIREVVERLASEPGDEVWEIGPGHGSLTAVLADTGAMIRAFEIDERFKEQLTGTFGSRVTFHWGDFLRLDLASVKPGGKSFLACGNLPYYCGAAIVKRMLELIPAPIRMVFVLQEEVAHKIVAAQGTKEYGFLSAQIQLFSKIVLGGTYPPDAFFPPPKVSSTVLEVIPLDLTDEERKSRLAARKLLSIFFCHRRKMALPLLKHAYPDEASAWEEKFLRLGIKLTARGEEMPLPVVIALAKDPQRS